MVTMSSIRAGRMPQGCAAGTPGTMNRTTRCPPAPGALGSPTVLPSPPTSCTVASRVHRRLLHCDDMPGPAAALLPAAPLAAPIDSSAQLSSPAGPFALRLPIGAPSGAAPGTPKAGSPPPLDAGSPAPLPRAAAADTPLPVPGRQRRKADTLALNASAISWSIRGRTCAECSGRGIPNSAATFRTQSRFPLT